jgi:hypothetical protein
MAYLEEGFRDPPREYRPWVFWLWKDGFITREGILEDLESMHRAGIGGVTIMSIGSHVPGGPPVEEGPVDFMSEEFISLFLYALEVSTNLGMEVGMSVCDGFAHAGGPMITPELSMQQLTWSEKILAGPARFSGPLEPPASTFDYYRDIAVFAFRSGESGPGPEHTPVSRLHSNAPEAAVKGGLEAVRDGDPDTYLTLSRPAGEDLYIQWDFEEAYPCRAVTLSMPEFNRYQPRESHRAASAELQVSGDGKEYKSIAAWNLFWRRQHHPGLQALHRTNPITVRLDEVQSRHYRLVLKTREKVDLGEAQLISSDRVHFWEAKAGFAEVWGYDGGADYLDNLKLESRNASPDPNSPGGIPDKKVYRSPAGFIEKDNVVDLTDKFREDGTLDWEVPAGNWTVVRMGHTPTGQNVMPATSAGMGLECNKLDPAGIETQFQHVILPLLKKTREIQNAPFSFAHVDSWEASFQNWTPGFREEFTRRRGYDPAPYYPVLTGGLVVNGIVESERFLWDYRRTISDLIEDNFFGRFRELCHENGILFHAQPSGAQQFLRDPIAFHNRADIPMGEFWMGHPPRIDTKYASSSAHLFDRAIVAGEAFSGSHPAGPWQADPGYLKKFGDAALCMGITRFEIQTSANMPPAGAWSDPGRDRWGWGVRFDRSNTWYEQSGSWLKYLSRCQFLLRQGRSVADILCLTAEGTPSTVGFREEYEPAIPPGFDYDACNPPVLLNRMDVRGGAIRVNGGLEYRILVLPDRSDISPILLRRIKDLVEKGAVVVGPKPYTSCGLKDYPGAETEVRRMAEEMWGPVDGVQVLENDYGRGRVIWGKRLEEVLEGLEIPPDFEPDTGIMGRLDYIHRRTKETDIYFVRNRTDDWIQGDCKFRVRGRIPEFWDPVSGRTGRAVSFLRTGDGRISLSVKLAPYGSVFVLFRESEGPVDAGAPPYHIYPDGLMPVMNTLALNENWKLSFPMTGGENLDISLGELGSWTQSEDPRIRYFSGTATYRKVFDLPEGSAGSNLRWLLDLGEIKNLAEVSLNGQNAGILWTLPLECDISRFVRDGENHLEIRVTNLWPNRLIGDMALPENERRFCTCHPYTKDSPLLPSGLFGPVSIRAFQDRMPAADMEHSPAVQ